MADIFHLPISTTNGVRMPRAYTSVIRAIINRITEHGNVVEGKPICVPEGYFDIVLRPGKLNGIGTNHGRVRVRFSYRNLYLQAFKSHGMWYMFSNSDAQAIPAGEPVTDLRFESGYQNNGMAADFASLRFGRETILDIYKVLGRYPNNSGGVDEIKETLAKCCVMFSEVIRFDTLRKLMINWVNGMVSRTVYDLSDHFTNWTRYSGAIRRGRQAFQPIQGTDLDTFDKVLSLMAVLLDVV